MCCRHFLGASPWARTIVQSVEQRAQRELDEKNAELAEKLNQVKLEQLQVQFKQDMEVLKKRMPTAEVEAIESARDQAYLRERQQNLVFKGFNSLL